MNGLSYLSNVFNLSSMIQFLQNHKKVNFFTVFFSHKNQQQQEPLKGSFELKETEKELSRDFFFFFGECVSLTVTE